MIKKLIAMGLLIAAFILSSCAMLNPFAGIASGFEENEPLDPHSNSVTVYHELLDTTRGKALEVLDCFDRHDKEALKKMFSAAASSEYPLDEQIDKVFEIYDSSSVRYEETSAGISSESVSNGYVYRSNYLGRIHNIEDENGRSFGLDILICRVDDDTPDNIGIERICLTDGEHQKIRIIGSYSDHEKEFAE